MWWWKECLKFYIDFTFYANVIRLDLRRKIQMWTKYILFLLICFISCTREHATVKIFNSKRFVVCDTVIDANQFLQFDDTIVDYPIYYIGKGSDTISIGKRYWRGRTLWIDKLEFPLCRNYSNQTLEIYVDTTIKTNSPVEYLSDDPQIARDSTLNYHSFLVTIKNISDSTIYLGRTFSVYFIGREIKNKEGNWIKVGKKLSELGLCLTDEPTITLKPNEFLISKVRRYEGTLFAECRLAFEHKNRIVYSNVFMDSVDERTLIVARKSR